MAQEDKELLLQDLSARLPHKTYVKTTKGIGYIYAINTSQLIELSVANNFKYWSEVFNIDECKPYLRPMSSMTEEERKEYEDLIIHKEHINAQGQKWDIDCFSFEGASRLINWLNAHHFDYRGLIPKGLALEAPEGMYITT